jgi:chaperonin cofactor prefoldin
MLLYGMQRVDIMDDSLLESIKVLNERVKKLNAQKTIIEKEIHEIRVEIEDKTSRVFEIIEHRCESDNE